MTIADDPRTNAAVRFYADALTEGEELFAAAGVDGLDGELALLRKTLHQHADDHPEDVELLLKSAALIVRAVVARYRISPRRADDLTAVLAGVSADLWIQLTGGDDV